MCIKATKTYYECQISNVMMKRIFLSIMSEYYISQGKTIDSNTADFKLMFASDLITNNALFTRQIRCFINFMRFLRFEVAFHRLFFN